MWILVSLGVKGVGRDFDDLMRSSRFEYNPKHPCWQRHFECEYIDPGIKDACDVLEPIFEMIKDVPDSKIQFNEFDVIIELEDLPESVAVLGRIASSEAMERLGRLRIDFRISVENPLCANFFDPEWMEAHKEELDARFGVDDAE